MDSSLEVTSQIEQINFNTGPYRFFKISLLHLKPIKLVSNMLILLPLWWVLGIEQLIWPIGFTLIALLIVAQNGYKLKAPATIKWLTLFLVAQLISGFFIVEGFRWITFARNFSTYVAVLSLIIIFTNTTITWKNIQEVIIALLIMMVLSCILGIFAFLDIFRPTFTTAIGKVLPGWIASTDYGGLIAYRTVGKINWFVGLGNYFRVSSLFLYPTHYASALAISLPLAFYMLKLRNNFLYYGFWFVIIFIMTGNLILTTGRMAFASFCLGWCYYIIFISRARNLTRIIAVVGILISLMFISYYPEVINESYNQFVYARGGGSFLSRIKIYTFTVDGILERPIFGWGTERDFHNFPYPAGSHSTYLGILYKHGMVGLIAFLGLLYGIWKETKPINLGVNNNVIRQMQMFLFFGRWSIVVSIINAATDILDLDATSLIVLWVIIACLIATRSCLQQTILKDSSECTSKSTSLELKLQK